MIYFQVVCPQHNFQSNLFVKRIDAIRSATAHRKAKPGLHNIQILEVWIANENIQVRSTENLK
ncbi:hypothetical protein SAMN05421679_101407 [Epilithonimonas pallida]|uniref:Uncharacterized protein n=1 Tax=Epilithonimonas pallida TaxID=373671 RepID=A0ABY1R0A2_9FLAO|nr:hypothetical protein SAMN05421679_101407 [Epilithonimonas pallida]